MDTQEVVAGIDVAKDAVEMAVGRDGSVRSFATTPSGLKKLVSALQRARVGLVVMEATGPYSAPVADALWDAELSVSIVNPRQCRQFACSVGRSEKTDAIDARMLSWFGEAVRPTPSTPPTAERRRLRALCDRRNQVVEQRVREQQRLAVGTDPTVRRGLQSSIARCNRELAKLEAALEALLADSESEVHELASQLRSVPGIGPVTVITLLAYLPELGQASHKAIAKLVGVAPLCRDSGKHVGHRFIKGGRRRVRNVLYMAACSAVIHNPAIRTYHQRLKATGKPGKVCLVACMRKLLTILNAMARDRVAWDPTAFKNPALEAAA